MHSDGSEDGREGTEGLAFGGDHILELSGLSEEVEEVEVRRWIEPYVGTSGRRPVQPSLSYAPMSHSSFLFLSMAGVVCKQK